MNSSHIVDENLIAYAANELTEVESVTVRDHIAVCTECNSTVALFKYIRGLMRGDYGQDAPPAAIARACKIFGQSELSRPISPSSPNWFELLQVMTRRLFAPAMTMVALLLILVVGRVTIASVDNSLPGDSLYPVKVNVEGLQLALALNQDDKANLLLNFADKRMNELVTLKDKGRYDYIPTTIASYEDAVNQATNLFDDLTVTNSDSASAVGGMTVDHLANNTAVLAQLLDQVPPQAQAAIQHAIVVSDENRFNATNKLEQLPTKPNATKTPRPTATPTATNTIPKFNSPDGPNPTATPTNKIKPPDKPAATPTDRVKPPDKPTATPTDRVKPPDKPTATPTATSTATPTATPTDKSRPTARPNPNDKNPTPDKDKNEPGPPNDKKNP